MLLRWNSPFALPKIDPTGAQRILFHPGIGVPEKQWARGMDRQHNFEVWAVQVVWPGSHMAKNPESTPPLGNNAD
jgi:hypothetical protein